jgi:alanine racemase
LQDEKRRAWVEVDLGALGRNAAVMARRARVPILPMVKSDAYGLGVEAVVPALEAVDPWGYGVATIEEGAQLRRIGVHRPVIVFTPVLEADMTAMRTARLTPTLSDVDRIEAWHAVGGGGAWHLSIDTGMSRTGVRWDRVNDVVEACRRHPPEGAFTHFHSAERNDGTMQEQQERFRQALASLPYRPRYVHAENSPATERQSPSPWDLTRPGLFLYGAGGTQGAAVRPEHVASLHGLVVELRDVAEGDVVSYRATWRATRPSRIATVSAGYADGVNRRLGNRGHALVRGQRAPIAGVVTMDMTMLDVTGIGCSIGDVATFIGNQAGATMSVNDVAAVGEISPYELLVGLGLRATRIYSQ